MVEHVHHLLQPRDILLSTATLTGFTLAAFGIIITLGQTSPEIMKLSGVLLFAIFFFISSAIITIIHSLSRNLRFWKYAQAMQVMGWISIAFFMFGLLIDFTYGIDLFSISLPQIQLEPQTIIAIISVIVSISTGALLTYLLSYRRASAEIRKLLNEIPDYKPVRQVPNQIPDIQISFIDKSIQIEKKIRDLLVRLDMSRDTRIRSVLQISRLLRERGLISERLLNAIHLMWKTRNAAIHGIDVPEDDLRNALELADYILLVLDRIQH